MLYSQGLPLEFFLDEEQDPRLEDMSTTGRRLLFAKLLHFTSCLANAAWGRYAGIYLNTQRHLTPLENGVVRGGCACTD